MSVNSEIERLQTAKADLKTAIENKGITVPSNTKLDGYADLVDSISGGGGSVPYIVNPLNGDCLGESDYRGGVYNHQYQLSDGNITAAYFLTTGFKFGPTPSEQSLTYYQYDTNKTVGIIFSPWTSSSELMITQTGLMSLILGELPYSYMTWTQCNRDAYVHLYYVVLISDLGHKFIDNFYLLNNPSCFIKGTKISLANGETISVEDVDYNDDILVWNFDEGKYDSAKPLWIKKTETTTWYYKLKFSNGLELKVTGTYPEAHSLFSVEDGKFIHANKLVGKKAYTLDGIATLESCEEVHENVEFYNIITNYHMNLFANNVLTSTSLNNLYPIKDMKFIKEDRKPVFDYTQFSDDWILGARLKEQPTDVTKYCLNCIKLSK